MDNSLAVPHEVKHGLTIVPRNSTLSYVYPGKMETYVHIKSCILYRQLCIHCIYSSIIYNTPNWKQPKCSSTDGWVDKWKVVCLYNGIISGNERNSVLIHATMWKNFEIMLTKRLQKTTYYMISFIGIPHFIALCFIELCIFYVFYKLKVYGNPAVSKSIGAIFSTTFAHIVFLCHILVTLATFQTSTLFLYLWWWPVISDL